MLMATIKAGYVMRFNGKNLLGINMMVNLRYCKIDCFTREILKGLGNLESLRVKENPPEIFKDFSILFKKLDDKDFIVLKRYLKESLGSFMFNFLRVIEEHQEYKLIYEEDGKQVNLIEISEMLKSEPIIANGWIERFSNE